jgi:hypothetical protein
MQWLRTVRNGGKLYWKPKSTTDCSVREEEEEQQQPKFMKYEVFAAVRISEMKEIYSS